MERRAYPSDVSAREWQIIEPLLPKSKLRGRKRDTDLTDLREVVNAIFYLLKEGCEQYPGLKSQGLRSLRKKPRLS
jgi:putative transposase